MENIIIIEGIDCKRWLLEVIAVRAHIGEVADSGHYVAFVKRKEGWYLMDDESITKIDFEAEKKKEGS